MTLSHTITRSGLLSLNSNSELQLVVFALLPCYSYYSDGVDTVVPLEHVLFGSSITVDPVHCSCNQFTLLLYYTALKIVLGRFYCLPSLLSILRYPVSRCSTCALKFVSLLGQQRTNLRSYRTTYDQLRLTYICL